MNFFEILKNIFYYRTPQVAASEVYLVKTFEFEIVNQVLKISVKRYRFTEIFNTWLTQGLELDR